MDLVFFIGLTAAALRFATPILFAALGETVAQRAGVLNVGLEGVMLVAAFLAVLGAMVTGSPWGGLLFAVVGGGLVSLLHGFFAITLRANQIVSGLALIVLGVGLSSFGYRLTIGAGQTAIGDVPSFPRLHLGLLSELPFVGPALLNQYALVYAAFAMALVLWWFLRRTTWGLEIRAVGENPKAADAAGISVIRTRYACVAFGGMMAGVGGAFLSIAQLSGFVENMVAGRGFIAIVCVLFGRWNPIYVMLAALLFGVADAAQIRFQALDTQIPYQFFVMLPYVLAVVALIFFAKGAKAPSALMQPFRPSR